MHTSPKKDNRPADDSALAAETRAPGLARELWHFLRHNKKWWLAPILIAMLLLGMLVALAGGAAPYIYALF